MEHNERVVVSFSSSKCLSMILMLWRNQTKKGFYDLVAGLLTDLNFPLCSTYLEAKSNNNRKIYLATIKHYFNFYEKFWN